MKECEHKLIIKMHQLEGEKCLITDELCEDNPNCYYKKLQKIEEFSSKTEYEYEGCENCIKYIFQQIKQIINEDK